MSLKFDSLENPLQLFDKMSDLENKIDFDEVYLVIPAYNEEKQSLPLLRK